jgi:hypothetical protein
MPPCSVKKALSPVVASIILLSVVIAVSLATAAWINGLPTPDVNSEELHATKHQWGPNSAYIDVTLNNTGTQSVSLSRVTVNAQPATVLYIFGSSQINSGESAIMRISSTFTPETTCQLTFQTAKGNRFYYTATA